jgi:hypothetical protein
MSEEHLHQQVTDYLRLQYPTVLWRTDMGGIRLTPGLRAKAKRVQGGRAWPDLFIAQPIHDNFFREVLYCGLFIELKKEGTKLYKKDGSMVANEHYREQAKVLQALERNGYRAVFAVGFEEAKKAIDSYLAHV